MKSLEYTRGMVRSQPSIERYGCLIYPVTLGAFIKSPERGGARPGIGSKSWLQALWARYTIGRIAVCVTFPQKRSGRVGKVSNNLPIS